MNIEISRCSELCARLLVVFSMTLYAVPTFAVDCSPFEFQDIRATVCRVDTRAQQLRMFHLDEKNRPLKYFSAVNRYLQASHEQLVFAMNAGMYHGDFSPVGLLVIDGREMRPINLESAEGNFFLKPNGVFLISDWGARVIESSTYPLLNEKILLATQSGPLLVLDGALHPAFRKDSTSRYIRNGVGVLSRHEVVFAISEQPVTFYEFAQLFRNGLGCKDALFLDATVSSLFAKNLARSDLRASLGPIIGLVEPKTAF
jgi:uncharacterized protein YigE (DUF2233 family)